MKEEICVFPLVDDYQKRQMEQKQAMIGLVLLIGISYLVCFWMWSLRTPENRLLLLAICLGISSFSSIASYYIFSHILIPKYRLACATAILLSSKEEIIQGIITQEPVVRRTMYRLSFLRYQVVLHDQLVVREVYLLEGNSLYQKSSFTLRVRNQVIVGVIFE